MGINFLFKISYGILAYTNSDVANENSFLDNFEQKCVALSLFHIHCWKRYLPAVVFAGKIFVDLIFYGLIDLRVERQNSENTWN